MLQIARSLAAGIYVFQYTYARIYIRHTLVMRQYNTIVMRIYMTYCACIYTEIGFSGFLEKCRDPAQRGERARVVPLFFVSSLSVRPRSGGRQARPREFRSLRGPLRAASRREREAGDQAHDSERKDQGAWAERGACSMNLEREARPPRQNLAVTLQRRKRGPWGKAPYCTHGELGVSPLAFDFQSRKRWVPKWVPKKIRLAAD